MFCWEGGWGGGRNGMWNVSLRQWNRVGCGMMERSWVEFELNEQWDVEWLQLLPCWQMQRVPSQQAHSQQKWGPFLSHVIALLPAQRRQSRAFFCCCTQPDAGKPSFCYPRSIRVGGRGVVVVVVVTIEAGSAG